MGLLLALSAATAEYLEKKENGKHLKIFIIHKKSWNNLPKIKFQRRRRKVLVALQKIQNKTNIVCTLFGSKTQRSKKEQ